MRKTRASALSPAASPLPLIGAPRNKTTAVTRPLNTPLHAPLHTTPHATGKQKSCLADIGANLEVRRHPGARRLTLRISRTRRAVIVTIPVQCDLDEAGSFLNRHIDWVRERLDSLPCSVPFEHGVMIPLRGVPHRLAFAPTASTRLVTCSPVSVSVSGADDSDSSDASLQSTWPKICVPEVCGPEVCGPEIRVPGDSATASRRLRDWLFTQARRDLEISVALHAGKLGVKASRIAVRDQTSRWGSCSTTGVLSFSWRLVLAPNHVLDYVAAHEVAHLAEMNHGPRFWALVRQTSPNFAQAKTWLQVYGPDLHRYGAIHSIK